LFKDIFDHMNNFLLSGDTIFIIKFVIDEKNVKVHNGVVYIKGTLMHRIVLCLYYSLLMKDVLIQLFLFCMMFEHSRKHWFSKEDIIL
jgi:hypothetical protein